MSRVFRSHLRILIIATIAILVVPTRPSAAPQETPAARSGTAGVEPEEREASSRRGLLARVRAAMGLPDQAGPPMRLLPPSAEAIFTTESTSPAERPPRPPRSHPGAPRLGNTVVRAAALTPRRRPDTSSELPTPAESDADAQSTSIVAGSISAAAPMLRLPPRKPLRHIEAKPDAADDTSKTLRAVITPSEADIDVRPIALPAGANVDDEAEVALTVPEAAAGTSEPVADAGRAGEAMAHRLTRRWFSRPSLRPMRPVRTMRPKSRTAIMAMRTKTAPRPPPMVPRNRANFRC